MSTTGDLVIRLTDHQAETAATEPEWLNTNEASSQAGQK